MASAPAPRQHTSTGPALPQPPVPPHAERVRTLLSLASVATLSTLSRKHPGFPFGSLMPYALDPAGRPLFLISTMAMHTQNLKADPRASLFVSRASDEGDPPGDILGAARATLVGSTAPVPAPELAAARELYLAAHPNSRSWVEFADFAFFRLQPLDVYYVGGFGVMGWVPAEEYAEAAPDPLAPAASRILAHVNADHADAMLLLARIHAGLQASEVAMTSIDRLGFQLRLKTADGMRAARINFPSAVTDAASVRAALIHMLDRAKQEDPPSAPPA